MLPAPLPRPMIQHIADLKHFIRNHQETTFYIFENELLEPVVAEKVFFPGQDRQKSHVFSHKKGKDVLCDWLILSDRAQIFSILNLCASSNLPSWYTQNSKFWKKWVPYCTLSLIMKNWMVWDERYKCSKNRFPISNPVIICKNLIKFFIFSALLQNPKYFLFISTHSKLRSLTHNINLKGINMMLNSSLIPGLSRDCFLYPLLVYLRA